MGIPAVTVWRWPGTSVTPLVLYGSHRPTLVAIGGRPRLADVSFGAHVGSGQAIDLLAGVVALSRESFDLARDPRRRSFFRRMLTSEPVIVDLRQVGTEVV